MHAVSAGYKLTSGRCRPEDNYPPREQWQVGNRLAFGWSFAIGFQLRLPYLKPGAHADPAKESCRRVFVWNVRLGDFGLAPDARQRVDPTAQLLDFKQGRLAVLAGGQFLFLDAFENARSRTANSQRRLLGCVRNRFSGTCLDSASIIGCVLMSLSPRRSAGLHHNYRHSPGLSRHEIPGVSSPNLG